MSSNPRSAEYGSDVVVDLMKAYGIEYVACNPGATFRGIHDSIVNYGGNQSPELIECCHEEISVAIAHGYAKATGRPMAAAVHNVVGLQHASMAIFNAWCDRVPVIVLGGTGPMDSARRRPWIDWIHTALVQGNQVRDYVKWDDQPYSAAAVPESFIRAYRAAVTEPRGPVYLCYDADLQEDKLAEPVSIPDISRYAPPAPLAPNPQALRAAAELLVSARHPVIIAGTVGRNARAVAYMVELAELIAAPMIDRGQRFSVPNVHPLDLTGADAEAIQSADVVLALDVHDLSGALGGVDKGTRVYASNLRPDAKIVNIAVNDMLVRSWASDYHKLQPADIAIVADTAVALPELVAACRSMGAGPDRQRARMDAIKARHDGLRAEWRAQAAAVADEVPISTAMLASEMWEEVKGEDWVLVNETLGGWTRRLWDWKEPYQWLGTSGGAGLGYGPGASVGAALAYRNTDKLCISVQADGDFLFCSSALWTAAHHRLPLLMVMNNNRTYYNSEDHQLQVAKIRGRDTSRRGIGTRLEDPPVNFAKLAESYGLYGEGPVERPDQIAPAIRRAIQVIKEKRIAAVVDVITAPGKRSRV
ncbi:MAG: thiamine pyrophosphate-binding protein [Chloroflexi bacterium]|nr:thiamine pyrophosphate-binding protein [Chloroflexota bacterium]